MEVRGEAKVERGGKSGKRRRQKAKSSCRIDEESATAEQISGVEDDKSTDLDGEVVLATALKEEKRMEEYRQGWEYMRRGMFGNFEDETTISCMLTTEKTIPHADRSGALLVYSIKVEEAKVKWPLHVYGMVAARDQVDYNRNFLFNRKRDNCQIITKDEPYLTLTGPSRAIVFIDPVDFEIDLKLKREPEVEQTLINKVLQYNGSTGYLGTIWSNSLCTVRLHFKELSNTVEATIVSVQIIRGSWPGQFGGEVFCHGVSSTNKFVLLDFLDGNNPPVDQNGNINLSRRVASVDVNQDFKVSVQAYSLSGSFKVPVGTGHATFKPKEQGFTVAECDLGNDCKIKIKVAWSLLVWTNYLLGAKISYV